MNNKDSLETVRPVVGNDNYLEAAVAAAVLAAAEESSTRGAAAGAFQHPHDDDRETVMMSRSRSDQKHHHHHRDPEEKDEDPSFVLNKASGSKDKSLASRRPSDEAKWQSRLALLQKYREQHGHCRVPQRYEMDGVKLGYWLHKQRSEGNDLRKGKPAVGITQERIDQLEAVGMEWSVERAPAMMPHWQTKFELLRQFRERTGHCQVPLSHEMDGFKLGRWVDCQRHEYKKHREGKPSKITRERIDQLESIGFDWNTYEANWQSKLELLRQYRAGKRSLSSSTKL